VRSEDVNWLWLTPWVALIVIGLWSIGEAWADQHGRKWLP
jgi:hypothetical protein